MKVISGYHFRPLGSLVLWLDLGGVTFWLEAMLSARLELILLLDSNYKQKIASDSLSLIVGCWCFVHLCL